MNCSWVETNVSLLFVTAGIDETAPRSTAGGASTTAAGRFGDLLHEVELSSGWCHGLAWSPSGGHPSQSMLQHL